MGHDQEDEEEAESNSPYLLQSGFDTNPQALPSTGRRRLLTDGSEASEPVAAGSAGEGGGGEDAVEAGEASGAVVSLASDGEEDVGDGEVVAFTRRVSRVFVVDPPPMFPCAYWGENSDLLRKSWRNLYCTIPGSGNAAVR